MKSLIRTVSVFTVLFLVAGSFTLAEDTVQKEDVEAVRVRRDIMVQEAMRAKEKERELEALRRQIDEQQKHFQIERIQKLVLGTTSQYGAGRVLVIPTEQMNAKELMTITEDLNIMSRILDRKLDDARLGRDYDHFLAANFLEWNLPVTKCIYLQEHGVLFMKKVNFPLSPPIEPNVTEKIKEDFDPVWEQTRRQMYFRKDILKGKRKRKSREEYDARKVETLKRTLITALKHAANIRNLTDDDWVIITIVGESSESGRGIAVIPDKRSGQIIVTSKSGDREETRIYSGSEEAEAGLLASQVGLSSPTVMTIRVRKVDVDEFYKGEIDFDTFRRKVAIFAY